MISNTSYERKINFYYQQRLNNNILKNVTAEQAGQLILNNVHITRLIANNIYTHDLLLAIAKYNNKYTSKETLKIVRKIMSSKLLKETYNYIAVTPELFKYYFNSQVDKDWIKKLYNSIYPYI